MLAGLDTAVAAWLVCLDIVLASVAAQTPGRWSAREENWFGWYGITMLLALFLLAISVASLVKVSVRSEPRVFRVLLSGTLLLALVAVVPFTLPYFDPLFLG